MKKIIGITGGIGCGKSTVMDILKKDYQASVILADTVGHELMLPGAANYKGIVDFFGTDILEKDGSINRKSLGSLVFGNPELLQKLNDITHPNIMTEIRTRIARSLEDPKVRLVCLESAILYETKMDRFCDTVWYVTAAKESRIERLKNSRGYTKEYCESVMARQTDHDHYIKLADFVLDNSGTVEETKEQIDRYFL